MPARDGEKFQMTGDQFQREIDYGVAISITKEMLASDFITSQEFSKIDKMFLAQHCPVFQFLGAAKKDKQGQK